MKRILRNLFLLVLALLPLNVGAQTWTGNTPQNGDFYLYNVGAGKFLTSGCQTATSRLSVGEEGFYWTGTLNRDMPSSAYNLNFRGYDQDWSASRAYGMTIRAVK